MRAKCRDVGRPSLVEGEPTIRTGFSLQKSLHLWATNTAKKRNLSLSSFVRDLIEKEKIEQKE